jgi:homocysteine S-methyltransferase
MTSSATDDPLRPFLSTPAGLVLDGGLATELERRGFDLAHPLWSARLLRERPKAIGSVHRAYLDAGADCITTASYQATVEGFRRAGATTAEAEGLLRLSVSLAKAVRDAFWMDSDRDPARLRPLVAASIGPYGACLADGSEYTGAYDRDERGLVAFHRERMSTLLEAGPDLLACETIPSLTEARALAAVLAEHGDVRAWVSFSCRDAARLCDGTPFAEAVRAVAELPQVVAVGVNCTAPAHVEELLQVASAVTAKPLVAYPNSGETYDARAKAWRGRLDPADWGQLGHTWRAAGARLLGGCCRTGPHHVRALRAALA